MNKNRLKYLLEDKPSHAMRDENDRSLACFSLAFGFIAIALGSPFQEQTPVHLRKFHTAYPKEGP